MQQVALFAGAHADSVSANPVNVASVPHRSPFRYAGGKTWFVPRLRQWLGGRRARPALLVEPFAGGGIISLTAVFEGLTGRALMVELDDAVAAVWQTLMAGDAEWLARRILSFEMSRDAVTAVISAQPGSVRERAFQTIVRNRTLRGGILAGGSGLIKTGEGGRGLMSGWYPQTLAKRLCAIDRARHCLRFEHGDAMACIRRHMGDGDAAFFTDPPYTVGGKNAGSRLYTHHSLDHDRLFALCAELPGDFVMTYNNADEVRQLVDKYGFESRPVAMKNTRHATMTELVISRDLSWMDGERRP